MIEVPLYPDVELASQADPRGFVFWVDHTSRRISYTPPGMPQVCPRPVTL